MTDGTPKSQLQSSLTPSPTVTELHSSNATKEAAIKALKVAGGVIIRGLLKPEEVEQIERDARPWLEKDKPWNGDFFPPETRRAYGMMGKSRTFAEAIVGDKIESSISLPQLMNTIVFNIGPGGAAQPHHRDDGNQHRYCPAVSEHEMGRDFGIGLFVAGKETTKRNGATRFIPGSHLWDYHEGPAKEEQAVYAELEVGDAFMMLSGCYHGASANKTSDEERLVYSTFMTRGYLRQEENQYMANDWKEIKKLPPWLQERTGFGISRPFLGWVNLESPMVILHPENEEYQKDLW